MGDDEINLLVKTFDKDSNSLFDKVWSTTVLIFRLNAVQTC